MIAALIAEVPGQNLILPLNAVTALIGAATEDRWHGGPVQFRDGDHQRRLDGHESVLGRLPVLDALELESASFVGHDWGAMVVWGLTLLHPGRVTRVVNLSLPYQERGDIPWIEFLESVLGSDNYFVHFNRQPGAADQPAYYGLGKDQGVQAAGQQVAADWADRLPGLARSADKTLRVDGRTFQTGRPGVFAGGDAVTGCSPSVQPAFSGESDDD